MPERMQRESGSREARVDVGNVAREYVRQCPSVLVLAIGLEDDISPEN